jgi:hypothetical protein
MSKVVKSSVDRFDESYPEELPDRLQWLEEHLKVDRRRMVRLMGLPLDEAESASTRGWRELVADHELQADQAEHLLTHYLAYFDYDVEKAREFARTFAGQVAEGVHRLSDSIPGVASATSTLEQESMLLETARQEGAGLLPAMAHLLGSASGADDDNATPTRPPSSRRRRSRPS